jgi:HprK-related kinase A
MNLVIDIGVYRFCIQGCPSALYPDLKKLYSGSIDLHLDKPIDFYLSVKHTSFIRRFIKPQVCLDIDQQRPFNPIKKTLLLPSLEWGMNWCIASFDSTRLLVHSSVLVKNGKAILFPAAPGSGKSTLATYFGLNGWKVYSDEMAIINLHKNTVKAIHRPASLKESSIDVIKALVPDVVMSSVAKGTHKGDIAHVKLSSRESFDGFDDAVICAVVLPKYQVGAELVITPLSQTAGFSRLVHHSFNYTVLGKVGFDTLKTITDNSQFFSVSYSSYTGLDTFLDELVS